MFKSLFILNLINLDLFRIWNLEIRICPSGLIVLSYHYYYLCQFPAVDN
jgi:hypothetical protein